MSVLSDIIRSLDLEDATNIVRQAYYNQGYKGLFGKTAEFKFVNNKIQLFAPSYTTYMLYGRGPGKMPPQEPIEDWMSRYGIKGNSWAIRYKIAKEGTVGNPFLDNAIPAVVQSVKLQLVPEITKVLVGELMKMRKR